MNGEMICDGLFESEEERVAGEAEAWKHTFAFVETLAIKSVVLLGIPNMIARHGPLSLSQIAAELPSEKPDVDCLFRILRFVVAKKFFRAETSEGAGEVRYALTPASKWILNDGGGAPFLLVTHVANMAPWPLQRVRSGRRHGLHIWDYAAAHPDYNHHFNQGMACNANIAMKAILSKYQGFQGLNSLVDVGGGLGATVAEIVKTYPAIKAINYNLPHVIATAPQFSGVKHVGGDMFIEVPLADAVLMKVV